MKSSWAAVEIQLARILRERRAAAGLTREELSFATGIAVSRLEEYETAAGGLTVTGLLDIAPALGCEAATIVGNVEALFLSGDPPLNSHEPSGASPVRDVPWQRITEAVSSCRDETLLLAIIELMEAAAADNAGR